MNDSVVVNRRVGLALSGGGSRAAAFHRGTVDGLSTVGLLDSVDVVSTVSGGSLFGAAWVASKLRGEDVALFLQTLKDELERGFIARSVSWRMLKLLLPGFTRTDLLADTFDRLIFKGLLLQELPERPLLCINTSVLNNGQVGKMSRDGFSTPGLGPPRLPGGGNPPVPLPGFKVARAAAASAAFPVGLPPVLLSRKELGADTEFRDDLLGHRVLALTDGGVLENLGVQTLLRSVKFGVRDLIVSDAGTREQPWRPYRFGYWLRALSIALAAASALERVLLLMSNKQTRSMRSALVAELGAGGATAKNQSRRLLFVRINQGWDQILGGVPAARLSALAPGATALPSNPREVETFLLDEAGIDLSAARQEYEKFGGPEGVQASNEVATNFTALSSRAIDTLASHARWQVLLLKAIHW